jgi:hypothetical protein
MILAGTMVSVHLSASAYGGGFGEIAADNGSFYVYSDRECYRDGTSPELGLRVWFEADSELGGYARWISRHPRHLS